MCILVKSILLTTSVHFTIDKYYIIIKLNQAYTQLIKYVYMSIK